MACAHPTGPQMDSPNPNSPRVGLIAILLLSIGGLWSVDVFLARLESSELTSQARGYFKDGERLMNGGRPAPALDLFRKAYALDRANQAYALHLADALVEAGKSDDGQRMLTEILGRSPNDGETNLIEARLMAREEKYAESAAYYHRAIYGIWPADPQLQRVAVRLELAHMLASHGSQKDLLAELLPLESDAAADLAVRKQVARLYVTAGSPSRAQAVYRALIHEGNTDSETYSGLGDAELALGDYRAAQVAFNEASRHGATAELKSQVELAAKMAALDPTVRRLGSMEKFERSVSVLRLAREALAACAHSSDAADLIGSADKALVQKNVRNVNNELAEQRLSMAERLWTARIQACGPRTSAEEEPLRLIMGKLTQ